MNVQRRGVRHDGKTYDTCGVCHRYTAEERRALKHAARDLIADGHEVYGRLYDGALFLFEDGDARILTSSDGSCRFVLTEKGRHAA